MFHEMGHIYGNFLKIDFEQVFHVIIGSTNKDVFEATVIQELSKYAAKNYSEAGAEVFSAWLSKVDNRFAQKVMRHLKINL